jgi:hypothetical protein
MIHFLFFVSILRASYVKNSTYALYLIKYSDLTPEIITCQTDTDSRAHISLYFVLFEKICPQYFLL